MTATRRVGAVVGFLVLFLACNNADRPTAPSSPQTQQPSTVQPPPTVGVPPAVPINGTFVFSGQLAYPIADYTKTSRYVLRDSSAFSLEYQSPRVVKYGGTYTHENGRVMFRFAADHRWSAVGTFNGDSLEVRYNDDMGLSDFDDAVYKRSQ